MEISSRDPDRFGKIMRIHVRNTIDVPKGGHFDLPTTIVLHKPIHRANGESIPASVAYLQVTGYMDGKLYRTVVVCFGSWVLFVLEWLQVGDIVSVYGRWQDKRLIADNIVLQQVNEKTCQARRKERVDKAWLEERKKAWLEKRKNLRRGKV